MKRKILLALIPLALAACSIQPPAVSARVPDNLRPAESEAPLITLAARGVQIYECRVKKEDPLAMEWAFIAPEAELFDSHGNRVGRHFAGPSWLSTDGSKVVGSTKARADALQRGAIPWLLLATTSVGPDGAFAKVTSIQRINTKGGGAPALGDCTAASLGKQAQVPYTADYAMFGSR